MMRKISQAIFVRGLRAPHQQFSIDNKPKQQKPQSSQKQFVQQRNQEPKNEDEQYQYQKEDRTTRGWMIYRAFFWSTVGLLGYNVYRVATHNKKTPVEEESGTISGFIQAAKFIHGEYINITEFMTKPPMQKLLPDVIHPLMHPKTLVLNVTGTLLETDYVFGKGLIVKKRPGLNQFLKKMSQLYEVVIFSDDDSMHLQTLIQSMDPRQQIFAGYFGHQCMVLSGSKYIKDLKYLNRNLKNIIVVDVDKQRVPKHQQNVITLPVFHGDAEDKQLYNLTGLLQNLAKPEIRDVRKSIAQLGDNPVKTYAQNLREKQQKIKNNKGNKIFGFLSKK